MPVRTRVSSRKSAENRDDEPVARCGERLNFLSEFGFRGPGRGRNRGPRLWVGGAMDVRCRDGIR